MKWFFIALVVLRQWKRVVLEVHVLSQDGMEKVMKEYTSFGMGLTAMG